MKGDEMDPKALIREAYRIDGIGPGECRSIFLDWALSVPDAADVRARIERLLAQYAGEPEDHPMTQVLREGLQKAAAPRRRGGRAARVGSED